MLKAEGVGFRFGSHPWLMRQVNITVNPGEIVGMFGVSGAGKTSLAKIMAGYLRAEEGDVIVDGSKAPISGINPVQLIWQHPEKVVNPKWILEQTLNEAGQLEDDILRSLEIKKTWLRRMPSELSSGELQRICIARALGPSTRYIIADEISSMLDTVTQANLWNVIMDQVQHRKIGVLAISHDINLLEKISARVIDFDALLLK
ncbi:ATP-binding cassette domain-containing protein [Salipaludibacillus sp. CF4.18]|uniref:ATP-binding cassette domain-containing protein n=1 Tax=Salipaludibacillus sp. CF4.18 TaxID=3373081 RepID=UPI003EE78D04